MERSLLLNYFMGCTMWIWGHGSGNLFWHANVENFKLYVSYLQQQILIWRSCSVACTHWWWNTARFLVSFLLLYRALLLNDQYLILMLKLDGKPIYYTARGFWIYLTEYICLHYNACKSYFFYHVLCLATRCAY
jgi:hypothetical protein